MGWHSILSHLGLRDFMGMQSPSLTDDRLTEAEVKTLFGGEGIPAISYVRSSESYGRTGLRSVSEEGSYLRLIDFFITQR